MIKTYQELAHTTAMYGDNPEYAFSCLAEEAGEVLGKLNKYVRKQDVSMQCAVQDMQDNVSTIQQKLRVDVIKELGDLQWQLAECCTVLGITLEELQADNLDKLGGRVERGTIDGEGDDR